MSSVRELVATGAIAPDLAALVLVLAEHGVPLVVTGRDRERATAVRRAFTSDVLAGQPARDAVAGGVVIGESLEEVMRVFGAQAEPSPEIPDAMRDLGIVLVVSGDRVSVAHYVRPVERDGAGHLQRRPPAVLGAWNAATDAHDDFAWALTDELATRAGLERAAFEDAVADRRRLLVGPDSALGDPHARH